MNRFSLRIRDNGMLFLYCVIKVYGGHDSLVFTAMPLLREGAADEAIHEQQIAPVVIVLFGA
ncbi:MAG: hypothetical protein R3E73_01955 [Porticoccaceae bacterium]